MHPPSDDTLPHFLTRRVSETSAECLRVAVWLSAAHLRINRLLTQPRQALREIQMHRSAIALTTAADGVPATGERHRPRLVRRSSEISGTALAQRLCCYEVLDDAARLAHAYIDSLSSRPVGASAPLAELVSRLARPLSDDGEDPRTVIEDLARDVEPGLVASAGPRYFGFVIGGALPVAVAADWLTSAWDQNAGIHAASPALAVAHKVAAGWVRDLLGLPADCSVGIVTGTQMAHFTCLAAARHAVLRDAGWDVEAQGLQGAPALRVIASEQIHVTIPVACRMLGLGAERVRLVPTDDQGRMVAAELETALAEQAGPTIVCAQAGEINTGAFDPLADIVELCRAHDAWCHIDGAFGLWAALSTRRRGLLRGFEQADSWATDGHKWLNVPYDCGLAVVADSSAHRAAMTSTSAYIPAHDMDIPCGLGLDTRVLAARAGGAALCRTALVGTNRTRQADRWLLRSRRADGQPACGGRRGRGIERCRSEPGARALRRRRPGHEPGDRTHPGGWDLLGERQHVSRPDRHADLGRGLANHCR